MLEAFRRLAAELVGGVRIGGLDPGGERIAAAALLIHAGAIDGEFSGSERARLRDLIKRRFELDDAESEALIDEATESERNSVDLYRFTKVLNDVLDDHGRRHMIEMLWQIAYADGRISDFENHLIWRVADLIGVDRRERIALRRRVAAAHGHGEAS